MNNTDRLANCPQYVRDTVAIIGWLVWMCLLGGLAVGVVLAGVLSVWWLITQVVILI